MNEVLNELTKKIEHDLKNDKNIKQIEDWLSSIPVLVAIGIIFIIFSPIILVVSLIRFIIEIPLRFEFGKMAKSQGKFIIFIYSNNPLWQSHIEEEILPKIKDHAVVLNWSERGHWDKSLWVAKAFKRWGGKEDYNPMALVYNNLFSIKDFRFYQAFKSRKHGKYHSIENIEERFIKFIEKKTKKKAAARSD